VARAKDSSDDSAKPPGSDFLQLDIADAPTGGLSDWLAGQLRLAISDGRLPLGSKLPATRVLAADLRVSRGVVTETYQRLTEDGHVVGRGRAGTIVVAAPLAAPAGRTSRKPVAGSGPALAAAGSDRGTRPGTPEPRALFASEPGSDIFDALREAPARIDLAPGVPDLAAFPRAAWLRAERVVLNELTPADFRYGDPSGTPALRVAVAHWLARNRGIRADPAEVVIVAGVAQSVGLLAQVLGRAGISEVAVEEPGSLGVRQQLSNWGMATPPVAVDAEGIRVDELRASDVPAALLTPAHQFPTGVVLDGERRRELMRWAGDGGLIIEDDYDAEHRYDRPPVPALHAMLAEQVCYTGSVSKLLAPALRLGWLLVPKRYLADVRAAKRTADLGNPVLAQLVLARLMESGEMERQLRFVRRHHRRRRDTMIEAVARHLPGASVHGAAAGLHLMITFDGGFSDGGFSDADFAGAALARGVKVQPLSWHAQRPHQPGLVLGYAANTTTEINEGVAILGEIWRTLR
jgi:GntR family transcriptional regulator / MocR family aminotransferase